MAQQITDRIAADVDGLTVMVSEGMAVHFNAISYPTVIMSGHVFR